MEVMTLTEGYLEAFLTYCRKHRYEHDESYLYEEDLEAFEIGENNPTLLLIKDQIIIGCLSTIVTDYFLRGHKSRVRIFHCETPKLEHYNMLMDNMLMDNMLMDNMLMDNMLMDKRKPLLEGIDYMEMFIPDTLVKIHEILNSLGYLYYRTAYVMVRKDQLAVSYKFPEGYHLEPFREDKDEDHYVHIRNEAFKSLKGSETPITVDQIKSFVKEDWILKDGIQLLWHHDQPIGLIRMALEEDESGRYSFVMPVAIIPEYHGRGLGTELLKAGIAIGQDNDLPDCMLSVNAENEQALSLYKKLGFEIAMSLSCFQYYFN